MEIVISCICSFFISAIISWIITGCMGLSIKEGTKRELTELSNQLIEKTRDEFLNLLRK